MKLKTIERECKIHGNSEYVLEGRGSYRCKKCRVDAVTRKRKALKIKLVQDFGAKCSKCNYDKCISALHFHHTNPSTKSFGLVSGGLTLSYDKLYQEALKCVLLCANCHAELHANIFKDC